MLLDLGSLLVNLWKAWKQDQELQAWVRLVLSTFYSYAVTFSSVCGASLMASKPVPWAIGSGLLAGASAVTAILLRAPQTRNMFFSVPESAAVDTSQGGKQAMITPVQGLKK